MTTDLKIIERFLAKHPDKVLALIEGYEHHAVAKLLDSIPRNLAIRIVGQMDRYLASRVLEIAIPKIAFEILEQLPLKTSEQILRYVNPSKREEVLANLSRENSKALKFILQFSPNSVGAHVETDVCLLHEDMTSESAITRLKANQNGISSHVFVTDKAQILKGAISISDLFLQEKNIPIRSYLITDLPTVLAEMGLKELLTSWDFRFMVLPVVNSTGEFIGSISRNQVDLDSSGNKTDKSSMQAGHALGELYLVGLSGLLGYPGQRNKTNTKNS